MKKYVLSGLIAIGCVVSIHNSVYADFQYDCALIAQGPEAAFEKVYKPQGYALTSLVDESVIKLSLQHLANYCCAKNFNDIKTSSPQACKSSENNIGGVESPYIFDQLVDLSFRKLDAYKDNTLMYGMPADIKGAAWQKLLSDFEDPSKNMIPEKVIQGFAAYRPNQELVSTQTIGNKCGVTNADALSLKGRYEAACNISRCISSDVTTVFSNSETSAKILQSSNPCMEDANGNTEKGLVQQRFLAEASYARQLLARVGIRTITNLVQQYTQNYFVGNRRQSLYEQFTTFDQYISFVNRKVQEGTPVCSAK